MPETSTPSTTGSTAVTSTPATTPSSTPSSTPAPSYGLTPQSWVPAGKPQTNQDFSRFDRLEKPSTAAPTSGEDLVDPDSDGAPEGEDKILDIKDIDERLAPPEKPKESDATDADPELTPADPAAAATPALPAQRDYTQFDEEGQKVLKRARNDVFGYAEKLNKQLKSLSEEKAKLSESLTKAKEGAIPDSYLDHPEAYTLLPEYQAAVRDYNTDTFEENHWAAQLERIEQGQPWQYLKGYDQQGNPVYEQIAPQRNADGEVIVDTRAKVYAMRALQACSATRQQSGNRIQQVVGGFKQLQQQTSTRLLEFEHQSFNRELFEKPDVKESVTKLLQTFPVEVQRSPLAGFIAKGGVVLNTLQARIKTLEAELAAAKGQSADRRAAGPTQKSFTAAGGSQEKMLDVKDFGGI